MAASAKSVQLAIRLREEQKTKFREAAERSGMDPSFAARQLLELVLERVETGGDMMDALYEIRQALRQQVPGQA
ncbi:MAG: hypothetical protein MRY64_00855 [Hyphomonadaceae bacterium]|nr:hypothetical protein [Hyphomonadaceae bacterium]